MLHKILLIGIVSYLTPTINCQCLTSSDTTKNETSIGLTVRNLIEGSAGFSLNLLRVLNADQKANKDSAGIFFSPHSIWSALVITYMGARGATEQEMKNVLGFDTTEKVTIWNAFRNFRSTKSCKKSSSKSYQIANRIYFQESTTFKACMKDLLGNDIAFVDFDKNSKKARDTINTFVEKQTNDKIKGLIPADGINSLTRMVVANAVYFKGLWKNQFDPQKTVRKRFTLSPTKEIFVNMMSTKGKFSYGTSKELQCYALELPYTGNTLSMVILLPRNRYTGVDILAHSLTPQRLRNLAKEMYPRDLIIKIPKFRMENSFELSSALNKLGLRTLFDPRKVDLSGFTGQKEFSVDSVHHKSFIDVNEEGTEAAGATAVVSSRSMETKFIANYPFIFFIRDNLSKSILFLGTVRKPPKFGDS